MTLEILIADDSETNRLLLSLTMTRAGYKARIVTNGAQAVEAFAAGHYDLVFLDLNMPVMNGIETAREINRQNFHDTPVYAISGFAAQEIEDAFGEAGIRRCLIKPLDREKIEDALRECGIPPQTPPPDVKFGATQVPLRLMKTYAHELRSRASACGLFIKDGNKKALYREAHTIRALAQLLGTPDLEKTAGGMEEATRTGDRNSCAEWAGKTAEVCLDIAGSIEKKFKDS